MSVTRWPRLRLRAYCIDEQREQLKPDSAESSVGRLTTHVLDTARGCPAAGIPVSLLRGEVEPEEVARAVTNSDGRCDQPLLEAETLTAGTYELRFDAGAYFDRIGLALPAPKFLDRVTIRFGIADPAAHYHIPLLLSPFGYSTYRGS